VSAPIEELVMAKNPGNRTACESLYAERVAGVKRLSIQAREWRDTEDSLMEED